MPTIHRERGFNFRIYPHDHGPPHVHVWKAGKRARIKLGDENTAPSLWTIKGMRMKDARHAVDIAERNQPMLLKAWRRIHGA